nr:MAG TPA: hypothetical protein [Caudoviricetes sp.]
MNPFKSFQAHRTQIKRSCLSSRICGKTAKKPPLPWVFQP